MSFVRVFFLYIALALSGSLFISQSSSAAQPAESFAWMSVESFNQALTDHHTHLESNFPIWPSYTLRPEHLSPERILNVNVMVPDVPAPKKLDLYRIHLKLAKLFSKQKKFRQAKEEYKRALKIRPGQAFIHFELAGVHYLNRQYNKAKKEYQNALNLNPKYEDAHAHLGAIFLKQKKYDKAEHFFKKAISLNESDLSSRLNLGNLYFYVKNNHVLAKNHYLQVLHIDPDNSMVKTNLLSIEKEEMRARLAEKEFESARNLSSDLQTETIEPPARGLSKWKPDENSRASAEQSGSLFKF